MAFTDTEDLSSGSATSAPESLDTVGTYYWLASYSGDDNNAPSTSTCGDETEAVEQATTGLTTSLSVGEQSGGSVTVQPDTAVTDTATLTGANAATANRHGHLHRLPERRHLHHHRGLHRHRGPLLGERHLGPGELGHRGHLLLARQLLGRRQQRPLD